jgi:hypothetical protein
MLHRVVLVRNVSEELSASFIKVTRIGELGTSAATNERRTLRRNTKLHSSETSVLTRVTLRNIPEDAILPSHYFPTLIREVTCFSVTLVGTYQIMRHYNPKDQSVSSRSENVQCHTLNRDSLVFC